jgi:hypothetical protein
MFQTTNQEKFMDVQINCKHPDFNDVMASIASAQW